MAIILVIALVLGFMVGVLERVPEAPRVPAAGPVNPASRTGEPIYDPDEATVFVHDRLPDRLRESLSRTDVALILDLEFDYLDKQGLVSAPNESAEEPGDVPELDTEAMTEFIRSEARRHGREYTAEAIGAVLDGEIGYMRHIGLEVLVTDGPPETDATAGDTGASTTGE